ncbi:MAG: hypothetical protein OEY03_04115 [Rhizobacter sp.]|nr:hypothetical protein [Rhizobacter sp.]
MASATSWWVALEDGRQMTIVNDGVKSDELFLERRNPDGSPDLLFGRSGRVRFSMGAENPMPRAIRADRQGRLLVTGSAMGPGRRPVPATLRFLPDGRADAGWGEQGRSLAPSPGGDAFAADLLPMPDDSVLLLGQIDAAPAEQVALWHLRPDGSIDTAFGQNGLLTGTGLESASGLGLQRDNDGAALIAVQLVSQGMTWLEVHRWQAGLEQPQRIARQPAPRDWQGPITLSRRGGTWQWFDASRPISYGGVPLAAVAAAPVWAQPIAADSPPASTGADTQPGNSPGHAAFNPFSVDSSSNTGLSDPLAAGAPWLMLVLGSLLALFGVAWWQLRKR